MRILVTGASGFLGRAVVESLLSHGYLDLRCFVRPGSNLSSLEKLHDRYPQAHIDYFVGNLASLADARQAVEGVETVYHLAAGMRGLPATIFLNTVVASKCLLDAIGDETQRVVLVSSLGVYGTSFLKPGSLVDEKTELDPHPERRNVYFHAKIWQERLFRERAEKGGIDLVVLRPGVLYGKDNPSHGLPSRVGIAVGKLHVALGAGSRLPLSHVTNCAEAVVLAGRSTEASGHSYNVLDDDLPTAREYLRAYKLGVEDVSILRLSFPAAMLLSNVVEKYRSKTGGQIPALLTPYQTSAMNKGHRFDNRRIKSLGWKQIVTTEEAMRETFAYLRARLNDTTPIKQRRQVVAVKSDILVRP